MQFVSGERVEMAVHQVEALGLFDAEQGAIAR
jgi:hypothetical protein